MISNNDKSIGDKRIYNYNNHIFTGHFAPIKGDFFISPFGSPLREQNFAGQKMNPVTQIHPSLFLMSSGLPWINSWYPLGLQCRNFRKQKKEIEVLKTTHVISVYMFNVNICYIAISMYQLVLIYTNSLRYKLKIRTESYYAMLLY